MLCLKTDSFSLELDIKVYECDIDAPVNSTVSVKLFSHGFSCETELDADVKELAVFARELYEIYIKLSGTATVREPYGHRSFIEFSAASNGHISVKGTLHAQSEELLQSLSFESDLDQTYLKDFSEALYAEFSRYLT